MFRKIVPTSLLVAACAAGALEIGCPPANSPSWWQNFLQDPVEQTQSFEQGVNVVLQGIQVAWAFVQPLIPAAQQATVTQAYLTGVSSVTNAEQILLDAAQAIAAAGGSPDAGQANIQALMQDVSNAISSVLAIVQQWQTILASHSDAGVGLTVPGLASAVSAHHSLQVRFLKNQNPDAGH